MRNSSRFFSTILIFVVTLSSLNIDNVFLVDFNKNCITTAFANVFDSILLSQEEESLPTPPEQRGNVRSDNVLVIHVGPHKTGTTSLQNFIFMPRSKNALKRDGYRVPFFPLGVGDSVKDKCKNHEILGSCLRNEWFRTFCPTETIRKTNLEYFQSFVNTSASDGSNILLSAEEFDRRDLNITEFTSYLVPQFKIHVVVYYRRFYDWIHSVHNQIMKLRKEGKVTFVEWLTHDTFLYYSSMYSIDVIDRYQKAPGIFNVSVVNLHEDPEDFNTNVKFACDHLDQAPHLCELARSDSDKHSNPSIDLNWNLFRSKLTSYHSIQLSASDKRWGQIQHKFHQMVNIPMSCLSSEWKDTLLQKSLESEIALTPESWHHGAQGLENLKADFEDKINSKLCSMDINAILTSTEWQNYLTDLDENWIEEGS